MAEQETPNAKTAASSKEPVASPKEQAIPVERLIAESGGFLGVEHYVVAGALHGVSKTELTVAETKSLIDEWLKKPVGKE